MLTPLTDRQKAIYDFLLKSIREQGFAPSIPEIGRRFKIASTNGVSDHLKALEKKGYIRRVGKRAIEVVNVLGKAVINVSREVPILGRVPAGKPFLSEENTEGFLTIPSDLGSGEQFALAEAVESLEVVRRREPSGQVTVSGSDPLNLTGVILPGPRVPARRTERVTLPV